MKSRIHLVMIMMLFSIMTVAQQDGQLLKNEISVGYGLAPASNVAFDLFLMPELIFHEMIKKDSIKFQTENSTGSFTVGYQRFIGKVIAIGGTASCNAIHQTSEFDKGSSFRSSSIVLSFYPTITFNYIHRPMFSVYSGIGIGVSMWFYKDDFSPNDFYNVSGTHMYIAYQFKGIGVRVGKDVAGFVELGFGYEGMLKAGLSVKFNKGSK